MDVAHPISPDFRTELQEAIIEAYNVEVSKELGN